MREALWYENGALSGSTQKDWENYPSCVHAQTTIKLQSPVLGSLYMSPNYE